MQIASFIPSRFSFLRILSFILVNTEEFKAQKPYFDMNLETH